MGKGTVTRALIFIVLTLILCGNAQALDLRVIELQGVSVVVLSGEIVSDDADLVMSASLELANKHKSDGKKLLFELNSGGGLINEGLKIGEFLSKANLPVFVSEKDTCVSACFLIFMKSPLKFVRHGARIGVHSASDRNGKENANSTLMTVVMARIAKETGVPNSVIGKMVTADPTEMHYLADNELTQMGARFLDDDNLSQAANASTPARPAAPSAPAPTQPPQIEANVTTNRGPAQPAQPSAEEEAEARRREELRAEQDKNFAKFWSQILGWSKAQHSGAVAFERRCNQTGCAKVVAYFDRQQRYVEVWNYDLPPKGSGAKLVCRQIQVDDKLSCKDWYDEHEFVIDYSHQIGADRVTTGDILDIFR